MGRQPVGEGGDSAKDRQAGRGRQHPVSHARFPQLKRGRKSLVEASLLSFAGFFFSAAASFINFSLSVSLSLNRRSFQILPLI